VGEICAVEPRWIETIWEQGGIPVIASLAVGAVGEYYNVNADQMAAACAVACQASALIFLTDVAGVKGADGAVIRWLDLSQVASLVESAVVQGGMLPKLEACRHALSKGVGRVRILPASEAEGTARVLFCEIAGRHGSASRLSRVGRNSEQRKECSWQGRTV